MNKLRYIIPLMLIAFLWAGCSEGTRNGEPGKKVSAAFLDSLTKNNYRYLCMNDSEDVVYIKHALFDEKNPSQLCFYNAESGKRDSVEFITDEVDRILPSMNDSIIYIATISGSAGFVTIREFNIKRRCPGREICSEAYCEDYYMTPEGFTILRTKEKWDSVAYTVCYDFDGNVVESK